MRFRCAHLFHYWNNFRISSLSPLKHIAWKLLSYFPWLNNFLRIFSFNQSRDLGNLRLIQRMYLLGRFRFFSPDIFYDSIIRDWKALMSLRRRFWGRFDIIIVWKTLRHHRFYSSALFAMKYLTLIAPWWFRAWLNGYMLSSLKRLKFLLCTDSLFCIFFRFNVLLQCNIPIVNSGYIVPCLFHIFKSIYFLKNTNYPS